MTIFKEVNGYFKITSSFKEQIEITVEEEMKKNHNFKYSNNVGIKIHDIIDFNSGFNYDQFLEKIYKKTTKSMVERTITVEQEVPAGSKIIFCLLKKRIKYINKEVDIIVGFRQFMFNSYEAEESWAQKSNLHTDYKQTYNSSWSYNITPEVINERYDEIHLEFINNDASRWRGNDKRIISYTPGKEIVAEMTATTASGSRLDYVVYFDLVNQKAIKGCHVPAHPIQRYRIQVNGDKISDPDYPTSSYTILHV